MARFSGAVVTMPALAERVPELKPRPYFLRQSSSQAECSAISGRALMAAMLVSASLWALIIFGVRQLWLLLH